MLTVGTTIAQSAITAARMKTIILGRLYFLIMALTIAKKIAIPIADQNPIHKAYWTDNLSNR